MIRNWGWRLKYVSLSASLAMSAWTTTTFSGLTEPDRVSSSWFSLKSWNGRSEENKVALQFCDCNQFWSPFFKHLVIFSSCGHKSRPWRWRRSAGRGPFRCRRPLPSPRATSFCNSSSFDLSGYVIAVCLLSHNFKFPAHDPQDFEICALIVAPKMRWQMSKCIWIPYICFIFCCI